MVQAAILFKDTKQPVSLFSLNAQNKVPYNYTISDDIKREEIYNNVHVDPIIYENNNKKEINVEKESILNKIGGFFRNIFKRST